MLKKITHIFYDLHGTLLDGRRLYREATIRLNKLLQAQYGGDWLAWSAADAAILAHWDDYFADLNFSGDNGLADFYEGSFRILRARFRLAQVPEPSHEELLDLSHMVDVLTACGTFYQDVLTVVPVFAQAARQQQGLVASTTVAHAEALLTAGGLRGCFTAPIIGVDTFEQYDKDIAYFQRVAEVAQVAPENCLIVDNEAFALRNAAAAGMQVIGVQRGDRPLAIDHIPIIRDLYGIKH
jgi:FMN phosphatase YigB (HAD superfamily)